MFTRRSSGAALVVLLTAVGAACGSGGAGGSTTTSTAAGGTGGTGGHGAGGSTTSATGGAGGGTIEIDAGPPPFPLGHVFIAGSRNAEVFEYDATLSPVSSWTHPSFGTVGPFPGQNLSVGPAGMAFDASGYLVVASYDAFCVFSAPSVLVACHPKFAPEPTENLIFDLDGNVYTTTATGGTNEVRKYDSAYNYVNAFAMPTGELTGVTCDPQGNLYVGSQLGATSVIYKVDHTTFAVLDTISIPGIVEGLQFASDGNILVARGGGLGVLRVAPSSPTVVVSTINDPGLAWAVPLTTDNAGRIYTADYENGSGTAPADLFVFDPAGNVATSRIASEVWGPFGMVVAGAVLPCGAYKPPK